MNEDSKPPKLFVSYSWTDQPHIDWVMQLSTNLRNLGVETVVDRWDLHEGQDAHAFMETMVRSGDVSKVILVCDRKYVERANSREGGVGAESQIVTSNIFSDVGQTKFVAVVKESNDDGSPALPNFLTSRIFVDFRDTSLYAERLQQLVRWAYDKPLYAKPDVASRPAFVDEQLNFEPIRLNLPLLTERGLEEGRNLISFLEEAARQKADFNVDMSAEEPGDETVYKGILSLGTVISQIINELSHVLIVRNLSSVELDALLEYFSTILNKYDGGATSWSGDVTKFFGQFILTASLSKFIKFRRFDNARAILSSKLLKRNYGGVTAEAMPLSRLNQYLKSLEARNGRLKLNRASLHSDLIKEICEISKIDFVEYMQADFVLYFSESLAEMGWWPDSLLYAADSHGAFPWFAKAVEPEFRQGLMSLLGVNDKNSLLRLINAVKSKELPVIRWSSAFSTLDVKSLANLDAILNSYPAS